MIFFFHHYELPTILQQIRQQHDARQQQQQRQNILAAVAANLDDLSRNVAVATNRSSSAPTFVRLPGNGAGGASALPGTVDGAAPSPAAGSSAAAVPTARPPSVVFLNPGNLDSSQRQQASERLNQSLDRIVDLFRSRFSGRADAARATNARRAENEEAPTAGASSAPSDASSSSPVADASSSRDRVSENRHSISETERATGSGGNDSGDDRNLRRRKPEEGGSADS